VRAILVVLLAMLLPMSLLFVASELEEARVRAESVEMQSVAERAGEALDSIVIEGKDGEPRTIRPLYDLGTELRFLTTLVLPLGLLLAWWLGWRMVRPLEQLQRQARLRAEQIGERRRPSPLDVGRGDEFGDLATSFNALLDALEERNATTASRTADLAHELKNPVAAIRSAAEALQRGAPDPARAERLGRILSDSSQRLDDAITALLELSRAEAGLADQERRPVDLGALVRGIAGQMGDEPRWAGLEFGVAGPEELRSVGVEAALESALRNLLANAASFAASRVSVELAARPAGVEVTVRDDGPGIPAEALPHVFERFFTTRRRERGTGLGLALVRAVAEAHDGAATVASSPGQGACFTLWLPGHG
jgi:signal transduction histidine kinase